MKKENPTRDSAHAFTDQHCWAEHCLNQELSPNSSLEPYPANLLPVRSDWTILEIGAIPGKVLLWSVNRFQYKPVGIDFSKDLDSLPRHFLSKGIEGRFIKTDFLRWTPEEQFNVVYSGGFIEHFLSYQKIISRHWDFIRQGGHLILTVPFFHLFRWQ